MSFSNRQSIYSTTSAGPYGGNSRPAPSGAATTSSLLSALHSAYQTSTPYALDAGTTLVVNTGAGHGNSGYVGVIDEDLGMRVWEHARRRAEDQTILLASLQTPSPSLLPTVLATLPSPPDLLNTCLNLVSAFTSCLTPASPFSVPHHHGLAVSLEISLSGAITGAHISISDAGLDTHNGLLHIPSKAGYRAFDVFYYLLSNVSTAAERQGLGLQEPEKYTLLSRSGTYTLPNYLPTADDSAAAEDWRANLRSIGVKGSLLRGLLSALTGILKLGNAVGFLVDGEVVDEVCEDVSGLLGIEPEILAKKMSDTEREVFIATVYEMIVEWVVGRANDAIAADFAARKEAESPSDGSQEGDTVQINLLDIPSEKLAKAICLKGVFDDDSGLNAEMKADGVDVPGVGGTVLREMRSSWSEAEKDCFVGMSREREQENDRRENVIEKAGREVEEGGFLKEVLFPADFGRAPEAVRLNVVNLLAASRTWWHLNLSPSDAESISQQAAPWSASNVSRQLRSWRIPEWVNRRSKHLDFTADFDFDEFSVRYAPLGCLGGRDGVESWVLERGWSNGEVVVGTERVWMREGSWWESENMLDLKQPGLPAGMIGMGAVPMDTGYSAHNGSGFFPVMGQGLTPSASNDQLLQRQHSTMSQNKAFLDAQDYKADDEASRGLMAKYNENHYTGAAVDAEIGEPKAFEEREISRGRRMWVGLVWAMTFWIPSFLLRYVGRMKRPDVRLAWREKLALCMIIFLMNAVIIFWIAIFSTLLCPNYSKAFNSKEVSYHTGDNDIWVSIHGEVYDISKFYKLDHSDTTMLPISKSDMEAFGGEDLSAYFPRPIYKACPKLVTDKTVTLSYNSTRQPTNPTAVHTSGDNQPITTSKLHDADWYTKYFQPRIKEYWKADLVYTKSKVEQEGNDNQTPWAIIDGNIYDLTDYIYTTSIKGTTKGYEYLDTDLENIFKDNPGSDVTSLFYDRLNTTAQEANMECLKNMFYVGKLDFRGSARCQANGVVLLAFGVMMCVVILVKFLAALQLGTKRRPAQQDKFVICQVPAYTEGEDQLRVGLDSLTALDYDNKRKLLCIICDGLVVGGGNDRPTSSIVLEILGVDPKIDPPALPFKSVGEGSAQLNYGKVYSGLYEYEGCVVPYLVVVKVGRPSEAGKSKPGNRGKRDSQILLLEFLNRVHHRSAMSPLQLEMFHQINNIIGVDPELYEYLFMVDADTSVREDSLNRLVSACANDAKIAGICGETTLQNEERSWTTMIQVYEYYISHHLAKAFESLFGSVTCLPGCFSMYRLRTADKGRPIIISSKLIDDYAEGNVDTLHKKNLFSLGEDRYLTTLMTKHFPQMSYKFIPDAYASTAAPESWSVLLSQRRRWINSTVHNLAELLFVEELCGMCCFSMRYVVFLDLLATLILPATCVYLGYLIYLIATSTGQFPIFAVVMIASVYGLQAIIFILKRQWQHVGWMIIYLLAFPIYSFVLPIYSFWCQDDFSWGNTRIVVGEQGKKKIIASNDEEKFDPKMIPLQTWDDYATQNNLPGRRGGNEKFGTGMSAYDDNGYEMDDMHSMYSSVKPASTILTGLPQMSGQPYMPPQSPAPFGNNRQSSYSAYTHLTAHPNDQSHQRLMSMGGMSASGDWQDGQRRGSPMLTGGMPSSENLLATGRAPSRSPLGYAGSRPATAMDFAKAGPDDESIVDAIRSVLREVDLETITKKQVRALVEQRLQTECQGERRTFLDRQIDAELASMPM